MSQLLYHIDDNNRTLTATGDPFPLAGNGPIKRLWEQRGKPLEQGWSVTADDIIGALNIPEEKRKYTRLIIDFHPGSNTRIAMVELEEVYLYTYSYEENGEMLPEWTPMLNRYRSVYYKEFDRPLSDGEREDRKQKFDIVSDSKPLFSFRYLKGKNWLYGKPGATNAAFIYGEALDYFRRYFRND